MATNATYDSLITGANAKKGPPIFSPGGNFQSLPASQTINTVAASALGPGVATDFQRLWEVGNGTKLHMVGLLADSGDTGAALDMDLILRDDSGDTTLINSGATYQTATTIFFTFLDSVDVVAEDNGVAYVGFLVNTAAATGNATMAVQGLLFTSS